MTAWGSTRGGHLNTRRGSASTIAWGFPIAPPSNISSARTRLTAWVRSNFCIANSTGLNRFPDGIVANRRDRHERELANVLSADLAEAQRRLMFGGNLRRLL